MSTPRQTGPGPSEITRWLLEHIAALLGVEAEEIDPDSPLDTTGLSSREAVGLSGELEDWLGRTLSPTVLWEHPNLTALALYLSGEAQGEVAPDGARAAGAEPIAIIGMACQFPGAPDLDAYWNLLQEEREVFSCWPTERDALLGQHAAGLERNRRGGWLDDFAAFDAGFFYISPREAETMHPQQRLLLQTTYHAIQDAGIDPRTLAASDTGIFVGASADEAWWRVCRGSAPSDLQTALGASLSVAANRLSYVLGLEGPSVTVDTACAGSLNALHLACQALRSGEVSLAIVGGVNVVLDVESGALLAGVGLLTDEERPRPYAQDATGTLRGEGCGVLVLRRSVDGGERGDRIYALVAGTSVRHGGRGNGLAAPSAAAYAAVLRGALAQAQIGPGDVGYVEGHGAALPIADAAERAALDAVLAETSRKRPFRLDCHKRLIGHSEAAAGMAGVIKVALMMAHAGDLEDGSCAWREEDQCAAVLVHGFGGANGAAILRRAAEEPMRENRSWEVLFLTARNEEGLRRKAHEVALQLAAHRNSLASWCASLNQMHRELGVGVAFVAATAEELMVRLSEFAGQQGGAFRSLPETGPQVSFLIRRRDGAAAACEIAQELLALGIVPASVVAAPEATTDAAALVAQWDPKIPLHVSLQLMRDSFASQEPQAGGNELILDLETGRVADSISDLLADIEAAPARGFECELVLSLALGSLCTRGVVLNWDRVYTSRGVKRARLPRQVFQREFYWPRGTRSVAAVPDAPVEREVVSPVTREELDAAEGEHRVSLLRRYLRARLAQVLRTHERAVQPHTNLMELGLDSLLAMDLIAYCADDLEAVLYPREIFRHPTVDGLSSLLSRRLNGHSVHEEPAVLDFFHWRTQQSSLRHAGTKNAPAIFLLSAPRSGSTLLRVMLAGNPALFCPPELHLLPYGTLEERARALDDTRLEEGLPRALMALEGVKAAEALERAEAWRRENLEVAEAYRRLQAMAAPRVLVDKSPTYGGAVEILQRAEEMFEKPRYIFLTRHPYAVIDSFVKSGMDRLLAARVEDSYENAELMWSVLNRNILNFLESVEPSRQHRVVFEELLRQPRAAMEKLCAWLGLPFDETMLEPYSGERMINGVHAQSLSVGDPNFLRHRGIDTQPGVAWQYVHLPRALSQGTIDVAAALGYVVPRDLGPRMRAVAFAEGAV